MTHLLLASTLKAYHDIIPESGRWRLRDNSCWQQSRQDPAQHAHGSEWAWIGVCCHLHCEALWRFFQVAPIGLYPTTKDIPKHSSIQVPRHDIEHPPHIHGHHRCLTEAVCIAAHRAASKAQSSSSKKRTVFLQETGFTNMGPCNGNTCLCSWLTRAYRNCTCLHVWRIWNCTWQSCPSSMPIS